MRPGIKLAQFTLCTPSQPSSPAAAAAAAAETARGQKGVDLAFRHQGAVVLASDHGV